MRPNDEMEFARAIALLMDDPERRRAMGYFGRKRIETEIAWKYSIPSLLQAYDRLLPHSHTDRLPQQLPDDGLSGKR